MNVASLLTATPQPLAASTPQAPTDASAPASAASGDAQVLASFALLLGAMGTRRPVSQTRAADAAAAMLAAGSVDGVATDTATATSTSPSELAALRDFVHAVAAERQPSSDSDAGPAAEDAAAPSDALPAAAAQMAIATLPIVQATPAATPAATPTPPRETSTAVIASAAPDAPSEADVGTTLAPDTDLHAAGDLRPVRDLSLLHPRLRIRVERVVARMAQEHGHEVRVVETLRSQARQEHLHAQGRERPGPVVTWTTQSKHTEGLAADLQVNGGWSDAEAYAQLQRIAREEGLTTLGDRDPGHVELRLSPDESRAWKALAGHASEVQQRAAIAQQAGTSGAVEGRPGRGYPRPAAVARAAAVATVATVARVATIASPSNLEQLPTADTAIAEASTRIEPLHDASTRTVPTQAAATPAEPARSEPLRSEPLRGEPMRSEPARTEPVRAEVPRSESLRSETERHEAARSEAQPVNATGVEVSPGGVAPAAPAAVRASTPSIATASEVALPTRSSDRAERAERIEQLHDARAARPLQSLTLRVADADGADHRIRVDLRGGSVATDIALADPARVAPLLQRLPELAQRLTDQGYDAAALQVRALATEPNAPAAWGQRAGDEGRQPSHGHSQHHPQSRHRGRREPGGDQQ
jgi:hypothetical protein